ncbi:Dynactin subunit 4 [Penicillium rolfsii]|nr:Dynactin subunit 4 [Penicillium rolfsii]
MSRPFPYTYISCPCAETPVPDPARKRRSRESPQKPLPERDTEANEGQDDAQQPADTDDEEDEAEEQTFDPRSPRSNFSLYPPEQLLYCEDCHQIKCPRCITEEIVSWYCPNCLFETPSSMVRSDGGRCGRNCFNCPVCTAPLAVSTIENVTGNGSGQGPWVLSCGYCLWTTLDIGIKFDKPTNIRSQLQKMTDSTTGPAFDARSRQGSRAFGDLKSPLSTFASIDEQANPIDGDAEQSNSKEDSTASPHLGAEARFAALKNFYRTQISETSNSPSDALSSEFGFSSPGALNRLMSLYASSSRLSGLYGGTKKPKTKPPVMREALTVSEGLRIASVDTDSALLERLASPDCGWDDVASLSQRTEQSPDVRFVDELLPLPALLRTKRAKRCKSCKHILVKPETKPQSTRFRIRLIALSYIPLPTLRPLAQPSATSISGLAPAPDLNALSPLRPYHVLLTLKNHMFDPVRITLATPSVTPGIVATKVTVLCPQFEIGANSDVWDEALENATAPLSDRITGMRGGEKVPEAGKVWEKGRNWTTVVLEVVPGTLPGSEAEDGQVSDSDIAATFQNDEDVLEIPVFVHMEWDAEAQLEQQNVGKASKPDDLVARELAYWMVLGVGRIQAS